MHQENLRTLLKSKEMPPKYDSTVWHVREVPSTYLPEYEWFAELIKKFGPEAWYNFSSAIKKDDNIIDLLKNIIYFFKHKQKDYPDCFYHDAYVYYYLNYLKIVSEDINNYEIKFNNYDKYLNKLLENIPEHNPKYNPLKQKLLQLKKNK